MAEPTLTDEDISTTWLRSGTRAELYADTDGTDTDTDGTDSDGTDGTDTDGTDADTGGTDTGGTDTPTPGS